MKAVDEAGLAAWHNETHRRQHARLLTNRYFQGTVAGVQGGGPFTVSIQRIGESVPDGNTYACNVPGYVPQVGDRVELVWRDTAAAVVVYPLATTLSGPTATAKVDDQSPVGVFSIRIPQNGVFPLGYSAIKIRWEARTVSANNVDNLLMQFNGDTGAHYDWDYFGASGTGAVTPATGLGATSLLCGNPVGGAGSSTHFNAGTIEIINYTNLISARKFLAHCIRTDSGAIAQIMFGGEWTAVGSPITYLTLICNTGASNTNFAAGSRIVTEVVP